ARRPRRPRAGAHSRRERSVRRGSRDRPRDARRRRARRPAHHRPGGGGAQRAHEEKEAPGAPQGEGGAREVAGRAARDPDAGRRAGARRGGEDRRPDAAPARADRWITRMADASANAYDELVRRLAAAARSATLYAPSHPLVQRGIDALTALCASIAQKTDAIVIGFIGDEVVVNAERLPKSAAALVGFARDMREREIEKITIHRGVTRDELRALVFEVAERRRPAPR